MFTHCVLDVHYKSKFVKLPAGEEATLDKSVVPLAVKLDAFYCSAHFG